MLIFSLLFPEWPERCYSLMCMFKEITDVYFFALCEEIMGNLGRDVLFVG